jgi:hypothetical protein
LPASEVKNIIKIETKGILNNNTKILLLKYNGKFSIFPSKLVKNKLESIYNLNVLILIS